MTSIISDERKGHLDEVCDFHVSASKQRVKFVTETLWSVANSI